MKHLLYGTGDVKLHEDMVCIPHPKGWIQCHTHPHCEVSCGRYAVWMVDKPVEMNMSRDSHVTLLWFIQCLKKYAHVHTWIHGHAHVNMYMYMYVPHNECIIYDGTVFQALSLLQQPITKALSYEDKEHSLNVNCDQHCITCISHYTHVAHLLQSNRLSSRV